MHTGPALAVEWVVVAFIALLALIILYKIFNGTIPLTGLLNEPVGADTAVATAAAASAANPPAQAAVVTIQGKASLSRLQLLLFTFVIAGLYLTLCLEAGSMVDIPNQVLGLLGISSGSYAVSKGIQMSNS